MAGQQGRSDPKEAAPARSAIAPAPASGPAAWIGARRRTAATTPRPVGRPVAPGAIAGMTYRDEQSVRPTPQTTPADYLLSA